MSDLAALSNPFQDNVVQDAWQSPPDVTEIHDGVFRACLAGIESASRGVADSLLIYGPAGSGKTHLLTRLQRHLADTAANAPDHVLRCVFVFVRLQTSPQLLWQHVRRRLATDLMRRDQGLTQLQRLIAHQIAVRGGMGPRAFVLEFRVLHHEDGETLAKNLSELAASLELPRDLCLVLEHLICNRLVRDASAWLAGDSLPERVLEELGLGVDVAEDREEAARTVVTALCRLAGKTLPIVFCFDQVEALQRGASDANAFFRFGRMAADVHDAHVNIFVITCLQSALVEHFGAAVRLADRDRMARRELVLEQLDRKQVEKLIRSRLELVPALANLRAASSGDADYPLSPGFIAGLVAQQLCVPRRVLSECAHRFEELQHGHTGQRSSSAKFLADELAARQGESSLRIEPADTTRIVLQGAETIAELEDARIVDGNVGEADLLIEGRRKAAISVRNEADGRSLGPKLKGLLAETPRNDGARVVIVRDPRLAISKKAVKAREYLAELQKRGAALVEPTVEALAALDALASILADAKSGDLANDGEPVWEGAVLAWIKGLRGELCIEPVEELVESILGETACLVRSDAQDLADLLAREHVVELEAAGRTLGYDAARLLEIARKSPEHFLVLEGPPSVLIDVAGIAIEIGGLS